MSPELYKIYRRSIIKKGRLYNVYFSLVEEMESKARSRGACMDSCDDSSRLQVLGASKRVKVARSAEKFRRNFVAFTRGWLELIIQHAGVSTLVLTPVI